MLRKYATPFNILRSIVRRPNSSTQYFLIKFSKKCFRSLLQSHGIETFDRNDPKFTKILSISASSACLYGYFFENTCQSKPSPLILSTFGKTRWAICWKRLQVSASEHKSISVNDFIANISIRQSSLISCKFVAMGFISSIDGNSW